MKRVLLACEESQAVCIEMRNLGLEAYSCDIEPCSGGHPEWHIQDDVLKIINDSWDMVIAFPPCTHLATSGARWHKEKIADGRQWEAALFFMGMIDADAHYIAVENPVGVMSRLYRKPDQYIQPYEYGYPTKKKTGLWLKNLPKLVPTDMVDPVPSGYYKSGPKCGKPYYFASAFGRDINRSLLRSKTFPGIAKAMADQWGRLLLD